MKLADAEFDLIAKDGHAIRFALPYLNDEKELGFRVCSEMQKFPLHAFVFNEQMKALEFRRKGFKSFMVKLEGVNNKFYEEAVKLRNDILDVLRRYTKSLNTGTEKVFVFDSFSEECPYLFATETMLEHGDLSSKFKKGLVYFINQNRSRLDSYLETESFEEVQKYFALKFLRAEKEPFKVQEKGETYYKMSFEDLLRIA